MAIQTVVTAKQDSPKILIKVECLPEVSARVDAFIDTLLPKITDCVTGQHQMDLSELNDPERKGNKP